MGLLDALRGSAAPERRRARTAAGVMLAAGAAGNKLPSSASSGTSWQERAWLYYESLGEIHYAAGFYGKSLRQLRLMVEQRNAVGEWEELTSGTAVEALEQVRGPDGGRGELQERYGILRFLVGEAYLFASREPMPEPDPEAPVVPEPPTRWEILSADEVKVDSGGGYKRSATGGSGQNEREYQAADGGRPLEPGEAIAYRLWRPHPRYSAQADSPMRAVLDLCEELLLLAKAVRARARSRVAGAGILLIPDELEPPPAKPELGDEQPEDDRLLLDLMEAMTTPVADEGAASAVVPMILRGPGDALGNVSHLSFAEALNAGYPESDLRAEAVRRIANGLDLPPEVLLGMADANHWTAWQVDEATWRTHIEPAAQELVNDLTATYLRPLLGDGDDALDYRVWYDPAALVNSPDRSRDAKDLYDRLVISSDALREAAGFDEADAPSEDELRQRIGVQLGDVGVALGGEPVASAGSPPPAPEREPGQGPGDVEPGPPPEPEAAVAAILGAAEAAAWRCREAAGARLVSRLGGRRPSNLRDVERADVARALTAAVVEAELGARPAELVAGGADALKRCSMVNGGGPRLAMAVESWAARDLYEVALGPMPVAVREAAEAAARARG